MRMNPFESQLERLARTLTDQYGVAVTCQGDQAYTDGRAIVLPTLPEPLEGDLERMMVGYLDHEMAHVVFSDFGQVKRFNRKHRGFEAMLNVVEDALIEKLAMQRWPGVRANLDALFRQVRERVERMLPFAGAFRRFCTAVYLKLSHHQELLGLDAELRGYEDLLDRFPGIANTRDSARLSEQLLRRWLQRQPALPNAGSAAGSTAGGGSAQSAGDSASLPTPTPPKPGQADESTSPADSQGESDGESDASASAAAPGNAAPAAPPAAISETALDANQVAALTEGARGSLIAEMVVDAIKQAVANIDSRREYRPFTRRFDRIFTVPTAKPHEVQALLARNVEIVRRLRRALANALRSAEKRWWREEQSRGGLSPKTLYRLGMDQAGLQIFRTPAAVQGRSTAVSVLLDASGSMTTAKMNVARDAMRVLVDALHDLRIPAEALTFTTGGALDIAQAAQLAGVDAQEICRRFSRFGNLEIGLVKCFEEPARSALERLPGVHGTGFTPLGEALEIAVARLIARRENRRILLTITDGHAGCEGGGQAAQLHAQRTAQRITQAGIELIGIAIQDQSLCAVVADTIVVNDVVELPVQLCRLLGRTLQKGLRHVG